MAFHVFVRPGVCCSPRAHVVCVWFITPVLACPEPFSSEFENLRRGYPTCSATLDSFFITRHPSCDTVLVIVFRTNTWGGDGGI